MLKNRYVLLFIILAVFLVYKNSLHNPFLWDQEITIVGNPIIKSFDNLPYVFKTDIFGDQISSISYYRPLAVISYMLDYRFCKLDPYGYHLTSIFFHAFNAFLVFLVMARLGIKRQAAFIASLIFAVHPVNSESVDYLINDDMLATMFSLVSFLFYIRFKEGNKLSALFSVAAYVLAILSKEWAVVVPFILLAYSFLFPPVKRSTAKHSFKPDAPLIFLLLISAAYVILRVKFIAAASRGSLSLIAYASLYERALTFPRIILTYLGLLLVPFNLHMEYHFVTKSPIDIYVLAGVPFLAILAFCAIKYVKNMLRQNNAVAKLLIFFILWFFLALAPFYNIIVSLHSTVLEHWVYFPGIGFIASAALVALELFGKLTSNTAKTLSATALALALCCYGAHTVKRNSEWSDPLSFYLHDLKLEPESFVLLNNVGVIYFRAGMMEKAKKAFTEAINVSPGKKYDVAYNNLGVIYENENSLGAAINLYADSIRLNNYVLAYANLARAYLRIGKINEALQASIEGRLHYPLDADINYYLALSYFFSKQYVSAKSIFEYIQYQLEPNYKDVPRYIEKLSSLTRRGGTTGPAPEYCCPGSS